MVLILYSLIAREVYYCLKHAYHEQEVSLVIAAFIKPNLQPIQHGVVNWFWEDNDSCKTAFLLNTITPVKYIELHMLI